MTTANPQRTDRGRDRPHAARRAPSRSPACRRRRARSAARWCRTSNASASRATSTSSIPSRTRLMGRGCVASTARLPDGVDCVVLAIPGGVLDAVKGCAERGVAGVIIFSAGFAEAGEEGIAKQREIGEHRGRGGGMVVVGPNCLGLRQLRRWRLPDVRRRRPVQAGPADRVHHLAKRGDGLGRARRSQRPWACRRAHRLDRQRGGQRHRGLHRPRDRRSRDLGAGDRRRADPPAAGVPGARRAGAHSGQADRAAASRAAALPHAESAITHTGAMTGDWEVMRTLVEHACVALVTTMDELIDVAEMMIAVRARCRAGGRWCSASPGASRR